MNQKVLWKISSLIERAVANEPLPLRRKVLQDWVASTKFFHRVAFFDPHFSSEPVMHDEAGEYLGLDRDIILAPHHVDFARVDNLSDHTATCATPPIYIFDNHHKALFAFLEAKENFGYPLPVVHIDAHPDDALPEFEVPPLTLENIYALYSQSRISDFLEVAERGQIISSVDRIVSSREFEEYVLPDTPFILSLDIDIFGFEGGYIELEKKVQMITHIWKRASVITIATSPGFIDQEWAWKIIQIFLRDAP